MKMDRADAARIIQNKSIESEAYKRQLHIWLAVGSAGGAVSMVSLAANLPEPAYVFRFFQPSLWSFLLGVITAGGSVFFLSLRTDAMAGHFAAAHNRDQVNEAIEAIPEVLSAPAQLAEEANRDRNALIEVSKREHGRAERAWALHRRYSVAWGVSLTISALAFVFGFGWPLAQVSFFGGRLLP